VEQISGQDWCYGLMGISVGFLLFPLMHVLFPAISGAHLNLIGVLMIILVGGPFIGYRFMRDRRLRDADAAG